MGSDPIALPSLDALIEGQCGEVDIVAVYTQPDKVRGRGKKIAANAIKLWARENGIPVLQPKRIGASEHLEIEAIGADAILVMAYGHMLPQSFIDLPRFGVWNLHTSILPKFRGASPIQSAIASGASESGVSLMQISKRMDAGPILDVEKVEIQELDTALELDNRLSLACVPLLGRGLPLILAGKSNPTPQNEVEATYVRKLVKEDGALDFHCSAHSLSRRINALFPWPGTRVEFRGDSLKVGLARVYSDRDPEREPGTVVGLGESGILVACRAGVLELKRLQRPGGKMLEADAFVRGYEIPVGTIFSSHPMTDLGV